VHSKAKDRGLANETYFTSVQVRTEGGMSMGIYIKGMEMPKGNDELRLIIRSNGQVIISHQTYYEEAEAVPVPPHGKLIDAGAFVKSECNNCDGACEALPCDCLNCKADCRCEFMKDISEAPTIIEAEEEKENV
jgi:hypothetical protein